MLTSVANKLSRLKSILGLTAASLIDKNWNQRTIQSEEDPANKG